MFNLLFHLSKYQVFVKWTSTLHSTVTGFKVTAKARATTVNDFHRTAVYSDKVSCL
nr:MAG TPA: hypothetical protein [Crassvirales sp.]